MARKQKCTHCPEPSLPGFYAGQGLCSYHWAERRWGKEWAAQCHPEHPEAKKKMPEYLSEKGVLP